VPKRKNTWLHTCFHNLASLKQAVAHRDDALAASADALGVANTTAAVAQATVEAAQAQATMADDMMREAQAEKSRLSALLVASETVRCPGLTNS
jgi:hypothetical protein